jgi:hypothetical protein
LFLPAFRKRRSTRQLGPLPRQGRGLRVR